MVESEPNGTAAVSSVENGAVSELGVGGAMGGHKPVGTGRIAELDGLRGIAALSVLLFHYTSKFGELYGHQNPPPLEFGYGGTLGVQLFFMISGFVIMATLDRTE